MRKKNYEEREIDILEIFCDLLEQWRPVLTVCLIFTILVPFCLGIVNLSSGDVTRKNSAYNTDKKEYQSMFFALSLYAESKSLEKDYTNSVINSNKELEGKTKEYLMVCDAYEKTLDSLGEDNKLFFVEFINSLKEEDLNEGDISTIRKKLDDALTAKETVSYEESTNISQFSIRYSIFGFLSGVFLYVIVFAIVSIYRRTVKYPSDIETIMGVRNFGNIYKYPYKGALARYCHSKLIYQWRKKSTNVSKIADDLYTKLSFLGESKITIVSLGDVNSEDFIIEEQIYVLESKGIDVNVVKVSRDVADMKDSDFLNFGPVFVQVISGKTTYKALIDIRNKLSEYNLRLIGTEFVEV